MASFNSLSEKNLFIASMSSIAEGFRGKNRMNLTRAVSGYNWGASKKALLLIYKSLIRSVIDYGDVVYFSDNKSNLDKLSSVHTEAVRLCCGAIKGTAALALQNECGEMP